MPWTSARTSPRQAPRLRDVVFPKRFVRLVVLQVQSFADSVELEIGSLTVEFLQLDRQSFFGLGQEQGIGDPPFEGGKPTLLPASGP